MRMDDDGKDNDGKDNDSKDDTMTARAITKTTVYCIISILIAVNYFKITTKTVSLAYLLQ